jgi:hypothetical protein
MKTAQELYNQFDDFFDRVCQTDNINILLNLQASNSPGLLVKVNNILIYDNSLTSGDHEISLDCTPEENIILDISMYGKTAKDTIVQNNQIVQDKFISIQGLKINNFDVFNDQDLFYNKFIYTNEQGIQESVKAGFWNNCTLQLKFTTPFISWYTQNSDKNSHISTSLQYRNNSQTEEIFADLAKNIELLR